MADVVLTSSMRNNLLSLQNTQRSIDITQLRLATGKKVNSALDNPQNFFTSQSLTNRANDLTRLLDGIGQSIQTIQEADKGITALSNLVQQAESIATEAQSEIRAAEGFAVVRGTKDLSATGALVAASGGALTANDDFTIKFTKSDGTSVTSGDINIDATDTIYNIVADINNDANIKSSVKATVDSNGRLRLESLAEGGLIRITGGTTPVSAAGYQFLGLDSIVGVENNVAANRQGGTSVAGHQLLSAKTAGTAGTDGKYLASDKLGGVGSAGYLTGAGTDGVAVHLIIDGTDNNVGTVVEGDTIQTLLDKINTSGLSDKVTAAFNTTTGRIELNFNDDVGQVELQFVATAVNTQTAFGFGTSASNGALAAIGNAASEIFTFAGSSVNLDQYTTDFNKVRDQINNIVKDANYRGVNLLGGDNLTTYFNEDSSSSLTTTGVDFTADGLGLSKATFINGADVTKALSQVSTALEKVRSFGSSIANDLSIIQNRQDFTTNTINVLKAGSDALTVADSNEEGANLLALQTQQQLGVTSLSLAAQSQQAVLRLF